MSYAYSEDNFIEKTAIAIFKEMKWQVGNVYQGERFGAGFSAYFFAKRELAFAKPTAKSGSGYVVAEVDGWGGGAMSHI